MAWTSARASVVHSIEVKSSELVIELPLLALATVDGRVTRAHSGEPISGARIRIPSWSEELVALSDANGRYKLAIPAEGEHDYEIHCSAAGFGREVSTVHVRAGGGWKATINAPDAYPEEVSIEPSAASIDFALLPERTIIGSVRAASIPVSGASVHAAGWLRIARHSVRDEPLVHTDSRGSLALIGLRPDVEHVLIVRHRDHAEFRLRVPPSIEPLRDVGTIEFVAPHALEVIAKDPDGVPVENLTLTLESPPPTAPGMRHPGAGWFKRDGYGHGSHLGDEAALRHLQTGADGSARFTALPAGDYSLQAVDGISFFTYREPLALQLKSDMRVAFEIPASSPIGGRVIAAGGPVSGARVTLTGHVGRNTTSKPDGSFSITGNRVGPAYHLEASWIDPHGREWKAESRPANWDDSNVIELWPVE